MDITYKWSISGVDGTPEDGGNINVVRVIHWRCNGYPTDYPSIGSNRNGFVVLDQPDAEHSFVDYADLNEELLMQWLFAALDKKRVESEISEQLRLAPRLLEVRNKSPLWMHWDPMYGPEPTPPPVAVEPPPTIQPPPPPPTE